MPRPLFLMIRTILILFLIILLTPTTGSGQAAMPPAGLEAVISAPSGERAVLRPESLPTTAPQRASNLVAVSGSASVTLARQREPVPLGDLPLQIGRGQGNYTTTLTVEVESLSARQTTALSPLGLAFQITVTDPQQNRLTTRQLDQLPDPLQLTVDYGPLDLPAGGSLADRLTLIRLSGCAQEGKTLVCREETPLPSHNDRVGERLLVDLAAPKIAEPSADPIDPERAAKRAKGAPAQDIPADSLQPPTPTTTPPRGPYQLYLPLIANNSALGGSQSIAPDAVFYVLAGKASSSNGNFTATPLSNLKDYQVGLFTGAAQTNYPIPIPPAAAELAPEISLSYDSGRVDGMSSNKNNQAGWVGVGWSLESGSIVRHLRTCNQARYNYYGQLYYIQDKCLVGSSYSTTEDAYSITLNGTTSRLVSVGGNQYRLQGDSHWKVEKFTDGDPAHPDAHREYWWVTTPDGTRYRFGGEIDPETGADQDSVFYVTVYNTNAAICGNFAYDLCDKAWKWNLDRVEDPNGNLISYFYSQETNHYKALSDARTTFRKQYVRAGHLSRIEYGRVAGDTSGAAPTRVVFTLEDRCEGSCVWPDDFPDTPGDLECAATGTCYQNAPTFWSKKRLKHIETELYQQSTSAWEGVARFDLSYDFPDPADTYSEPKLWLNTITQRPGGGGTGLPPVSYDYVMLDNRRNHPGTVPAMETPRIDKITTQLGGEIEFTYGQTHPCPVDSPTKIRPPLDCFVAFDEGWRWWQKWKVLGMSQADSFSGNPTQSYTYTYSTPTWHYSDDPTLKEVNECSACPANYWNDFRGHEVVTVTDAAGAQTEYRFYRGMEGDRLGLSGGAFAAQITLSDSTTRQDDNWLAGQVVEVRRLNSGGTAKTRTVNWYTATPTAGSGIDGAYFVGLQKTEATLYGSTDRTTRTEYVYDSYGNVLQEVLHGDISTPADDRNLERGYIYNTAAYLVDRPLWEKLWSGTTGGGSGGVTTTTCTTTPSPDVPKTISSVGTPTITSTLTLSAGGVISDVNLLNLNGTHTWIKDLDVNLTSPAGSEVQLMARSCYNEDNFDLNLDDEAAPGSWPCPPVGGGTYQPSNPLSAFDGEAAAGTWTLTINDNETNDGGSLNGWSLEMCSTEVGLPAPLGTEKAFTLYAYDGGGIGAVPAQGNPTLTRRYSQVSPTPLFADTTTGYDSRGRVVAVTDARSHTTSTTYHAFYGYAASQTNHLSHTLSYEVDPAWGVETKITDPNLKVTELAYDAYGRLTEVWLPGHSPSGPASLAYGYDPAARPATLQTRTLSEVATSTYLESWAYVDGFGRTLQTQRASEAGGQRVVSSQAYNPLGQLEYQSSPYEISGSAGGGYAQPTWSSLANYQQFAYDDLGNQTLAETRAQGSLLWSSTGVYDGFTQVYTDANGHRTEHTLDGFGQLAGVTEYNDAGSGLVTYQTVYSYSVQGNLTQVTDHAGNSPSMQYDLLGRKTAMSDPDMGHWVYQYDAVGNLTAQQDGRSQWVYLGYDALNRLTSKRRDSVTGPLLAEYVYDTLNKGQLYASKSYDQAGSTVEVEVQVSGQDDRYRPTERTWLVNGGGTFRMATTYDDAGRPATLQYPADNAGGLGEIVQHTFNSVGQLEQVISLSDNTQFVADTEYAPTGQVTRQRLDQGSNGAERIFGYSATTLRLETITAGLNSPDFDDRQQLTYSYDDGGNITALVDGHNSDQRQCFDYDYLDRLTSAFTGDASCTGYTVSGSGPYTRTYRYDAIGNITDFNGNPYTYGSSRPHAVTAAHGNSYGYDGNGNQTSRTIGGTAYTVDFDYENRLTAVKQGSTTLASFVYDAGGNRVKGTVNGVTTIYIGGVYEYQAGASTTYYAGQGGPIALRRSGYPSDNGLFYILSDHLGSTSVLLNQNGTVAKREFYYPFGGNRGTAFSDLTTRRFTGQYHEQALPGGEGLAYYNARWYDPQLGRFVSPDSIVPSPSNPQSLNRFSYVRNNPLRFTDPTGHRLCKGAGDCSSTSRYSELRQTWQPVSRQLPWDKFLIGRANYQRYTNRPNLLLQDRLISTRAIAGNSGRALNRVSAASAYSESVMRHHLLDAVDPGQVFDTLDHLSVSGDGRGFVRTLPLLAGVLGVERPSSGRAVLGRSDYLDDFAHRIGGESYEKWSFAEGGSLITQQDLIHYAKSGGSDLSFFGFSFPTAMNNAAEIHFNLRGVGNIENAIQRGAKGRGYTETELYLILNNRSWYNKTSFYDETGNTISLDFLGD